MAEKKVTISTQLTERWAAMWERYKEEKLGVGSSSEGLRLLFRVAFEQAGYIKPILPLPVSETVEEGPDSVAELMASGPEPPLESKPESKPDQESSPSFKPDEVEEPQSLMDLCDEVEEK